MFQDLRFAFRTWWKSPIFAALAILALALGIGVNSAIFSVVNAVVLQPLPFPQSGRLCVIYSSRPGPFVGYGWIFDPDFLQIQRQNTTFENVAAFNGGLTSWTGIGEPTPIAGQMVTDDFFSVLGVKASLGRTFLPEDLKENTKVVVLSDHLWRARFGSDRSVIGKTVQLNGTPHTVIGVAPPGFAFPVFPVKADLWARLDMTPKAGLLWQRRVIGRLKPGVSMMQARAEAAALIERFNSQSPRPVKGLTGGVASLRELLVWKVRPSLWILFGAVSFILLIACANVANLLLARGAARRQEVAVRASLGASRARLIRQLLTESALLALLGGALGLLVASWTLPALVALVPPAMIPRLDEVNVNGQVLGFTLILSLATSLLFGLAPAIEMSKSRLLEFLKQGDGRFTSGQGLRGLLVVSEIALSLVLLIGAGLMIKSFVRLRSVNPGFNPESVLVMTADLPMTTQQTPQQLNAYHREVLVKMAALPGVIAAGAINWLPFDMPLIRGDYYAEGNRAHFNVTKSGVTTDYFRAMSIPLLRGRTFEPRDTESPTPVAVIGKSVAKSSWGDEDPIGKRITLEDHPKPNDWLTVVGVVDDVKQQELAEKSPLPIVYQPLSQVTRAGFLLHVAYVVRATGNPSLLAGMMRTRFHEVNREQPIQLIAPLEDLISATTAQPRFYSRMLGSFSALALLLASLGVYGVIAYSVVQRTREIGIRVALGAQSEDIFRSVMSRSAVLVSIGVALGIAGALGATRVLKTLLFEVKPTDLATYASVSTLLVFVALLASYVPARRATTVDPLVALRYE
ncbi:MAG TPA: ABC transporter permease [Bryobacteraceae bacterium]